MTVKQNFPAKKLHVKESWFLGKVVVVVVSPTDSDLNDLSSNPVFALKLFFIHIGDLV